MTVISDVMDLRRLSTDINRTCDTITVTLSYILSRACFQLTALYGTADVRNHRSCESVFWIKEWWIVPSSSSSSSSHIDAVTHTEHIDHTRTDEPNSANITFFYYLCSLHRSKFKRWKYGIGLMSEAQATTVATHGRIGMCKKYEIVFITAGLCDMQQ